MTTGSLTGTTALAKLALRRDRIMLPVWIYVVVIGVSANAYAFVKLYTTASSRAALVASARGNPALLFLYGRRTGPRPARSPPGGTASGAGCSPP